VGFSLIFVSFAVMGFGNIGPEAIGKKGLGDADAVSPPVDSKGHAFYAGKDVCVELQGAAHQIQRSFADQYKEQFARHHHDGGSLPGSTRTYTAGVVIKKTEKILEQFGVYMPGSEYVSEPSGFARPRQVECILEHAYAAKDGETEKRESERKREYVAAVAKGWTISDCCMWDIGVRLLDRGVHVTLPPAEFDATCQVRLFQGWVVVVPSGDSDIPLYPTGIHDGEVHLLQGKTLSIHTTQSKAAVMATMFGAEGSPDPSLQALATGRLPTEFEFAQIEALYLACCVATPHDYHTRKRPSSSTVYKEPYTSVTGVSKTKWKSLCELAWSAFKIVKPQRYGRSPAKDLKRAINGACDVVIKVLKESQSSIGWKSVDGWDLLVKVREAFDGFVQQPVTTKPGGGEGDVAIYLDAFASSVESKAEAKANTTPSSDGNHDHLPSSISLMSPENMQKYTYRGKCGDCPAVVVKPWEIPLDRVDPLLKKVTPSVIRDGPPAKLPQMLLADLVRNIGYVGAFEEWRIEGTFAPLDYVLNILDRVATSSSLDWEVVYMPPDLPEDERPEGYECFYPAEYKYAVNGAEVQLAIVRGRCLQSYGVSGKEKTDRMEGAAYLAYVALEVDTSSGRVLQYPNGSSEAKDGILATSCPACKNPLRCRHVNSILAALCRVKESDFMSSTTPFGYWKKHGKKPDYSGKSSRPKKLGELATYKDWLSDILGEPVPEDVVSMLL
jgi:hypothetical protein